MTIEENGSPVFGKGATETMPENKFDLYLTFNP